ncbi:MAG: hypothetical protein Q9196_006665 [Gyalolechia fulgens]
MSLSTQELDFLAWLHLRGNDITSIAATIRDRPLVGNFFVNDNNSVSVRVANNPTLGRTIPPKDLEEALLQMNSPSHPNSQIYEYWKSFHGYWDRRYNLTKVPVRSDVVLGPAEMEAYLKISKFSPPRVGGSVHEIPKDLNLKKLARLYVSQQGLCLTLYHRFEEGQLVTIGRPWSEEAIGSLAWFFLPDWPPEMRFNNAG